MAFIEQIVSIMLDSECKLLAKVICKVGTYRHQIGYIHSVTRWWRNGCDEIEYLVVDDKMNFIGFGPWRDLKCWDLVQYITLAPMDADNWLEPTKSKECPCGISRADCDYHNGKV